MDITQVVTAIFSFTIVGALTSLIIETSTKRLTPFMSKLMTVLVSLFVGAVITWLANTDYITAVLTALGAASTVYGFAKKQ